MDQLHPFTPERLRKCLAVESAAVILLALALGWLGPALDAQPDRRDEALIADEELRTSGEIARFEAEARQRCARWHGSEGGVMQVSGGAIVCSDKHGLGRRTLTASLSAGGRP